MQAQTLETEAGLAQAVPASVPNTVSLARVLERYRVQEGGEVREFLAAHPSLSDLLLAAVRPVEAIFGAGTPITLQVLVDHEGDDDAVLKAYIQTQASIEEALEKRRRFQREWWAGVKSSAQSRLRFDVDCLEAD